MAIIITINVKKILPVIKKILAVILYIYFFIPQFKYMNFIYS